LKVVASSCALISGTAWSVVGAAVALPEGADDEGACARPE
jgi:hypothetical protein